MRLVRAPARPHIARMHLRSTVLAILAACSGTSRTVDAPAPPAHLALAGDAFYPESVTSADGRLVVGSFGTGEVAVFAAGATAPTTLIAASPEAPRVLGVLADAGALWLCADDTSSVPRPPQVRRYDLATGALQASFGFPAPAFCNDLAVDAAHNLYVTDSLGALYRLPAGGDRLELWSRDPLLAPSTPGGFGANGVAWDGAGGLYVTSFADNRLLRFAIGGDGRASAATEVAVTPALSGPDAVRVDHGRVLVVEQTAGRLTEVRDGRATALATGLAQPTSVTVIGGDAWVAEGQLGHILGTLAGPPALPFVVTRVAL